MRARPVTAIVSLAFVVVLLVGTSCQTTNPNFCCLSAASCEQAGALEGVDTPSITPCHDPSRSYCTDATASELGSLFECVPDPLGHACTLPSDCPGERPYCVDQFCVACEDATECSATTPVCSETHMCQNCTGDDDCMGRDGLPRCDMTSGACVACLDAGDCTGTAPVCGDGGACRACVADGECPSQVCDSASGACIAEDDAIYLATDGSPAGSCTRQSPCSTFAIALAQVSGTRNVIHVAAGTYTGQVVIDGLTVTILGAGATIQPAALNQTAIVMSNGGAVTIDGATITGAKGNSNPFGIQCSPGTGAAPSLTLRRSTVIGNDGGGVSVSGCSTTMIDDMIIKNGGAMSTIGGVRLDSIGAATFDFVTVADNLTSSTGFAQGVQCAAIGSVTLSDSIVVGQAATQISVINCAFTYTLSNQALTGTGNKTGDPKFVNTAQNNYHLQAGSAAIDSADPATTVRVDIDGDARPQGHADMGADEVTP